MRVTSWSSKLIVGVVVLFAAACDEPPYIPPDDNDTSDTCETDPTLSSLRETYFATSCSLSSCHGSNSVSANGGLKLTGTDLHARLVGVTPHNAMAAANGKKLVVANDADASFIVQKVEGTHVKQTGSGATLEINEGEWMPNGTDEVISPDCWVKNLREWIDDGAADN